MAEYVQMFDGNQPFKNGSYIYGKINKEIVPIYYSPIDSDTISMSIDNSNRTIQATISSNVPKLLFMNELPQPSEKVLGTIAITDVGDVYMCTKKEMSPILGQLVLGESALGGNVTSYRWSKLKFQEE